MEHTEGKLYVSEHDDNQGVVIRTDKDQQIVANCEIDFVRIGEKSAYAILANANRFAECWNGWDKLQEQRDALLEALESAELSLNECTKHLLGTGQIPDPEVVALIIIQIKQAINLCKK